MKEKIESLSAPGAIGPYSQGIVASGKTIYISGQLPIDVNTGSMIEDDIKKQTEQSIKNIINILEEAGGKITDVVMTNVLLKDMDDFGEMNEIYGSFFKEPYPARAAYQVAKLPKDAKVEITAVAVID